MKKLCDVVIAISVTVILGLAFLFGVRYAENKEATFERELNAHVLATWDGVHDNPNHTCEYGEWCTPHYAQFLRNRAKKH